jgi:hypothetical protein
MAYHFILFDYEITGRSLIQYGQMSTCVNHEVLEAPTV